MINVGESFITILGTATVLTTFAFIGRAIIGNNGEGNCLESVHIVIWNGHVGITAIEAAV